MRLFVQKHHRLLFYTFWIILALVQSALTELLDDEAYYWVYSKFLDWGYFDHPPMTAVLIKIGYGLFQNELGVRFLFVVLNALSLLLIEQLIDNKNPALFYAIVLSVAVLQITGFAAVPDTPLIFFASLFFLWYKKFLYQPSILNSLVLGLITACLLYSKYHAVLVVFFVLLSNPKLLTRYQTYLAGVTAITFFLPHLVWQYQHDWISFRYHLFESNVNPYKLSFTLEYLAGQILLAGPIAGIFILPAAFLYQPKGLFERSLKFTLSGIYIFFLLSSFRGRVEANWTSAAIVPLIILSHNFIQEQKNRITIWSLKWLFKLLPITMLLVLCARIVMIVDVLPLNEIKNRFHAWHHWPSEMKQTTMALPVVFQNSYQRASKYWFYSGQTTYSLNWYRERRNNYNFWPIEDSLLGRPVYILDTHNLDSFPNKMHTGIGVVGYKYDSVWSSFAKVKLIADRKGIDMKRGTSVSIILDAELSQLYRNYIMNRPNLRTKIVAGIFNKRGWVKDFTVPFSLYELITEKRQVLVDPDVPNGRYFMIFSIYAEGTITPTYNSDKITLVIR